MPNASILNPLLQDAADYAQILDASGIGLWEYDHLTGRARVNAPIAILLGYADPASPAVPDDWFALVHPEDLDPFRTALARQDQGDAYEIEYRILRPDGEVRWIWGCGFPVVEPDGSVIRSVGLAQDITARKHAEDEVRRLNKTLEQRVNQCAIELETSVRQRLESEGRFRDAIAASNVGLWDWNLQTDVIHFSAAFAATLDADALALPRCWKDLLHADDRECAIAGTLRDLRQTGRCEQEFRFRFRQRGERWVLSRGEVVERDAAGAPLRAIGTFTDIHDLKQAEALNRKLAAIIEASSDLIATASPEGLIDYINPAGRALLGIGSLESLERVRIEDYHPDWAYRRVKEDGFPAALAHGQWLDDSVLLGRDGAEIPVSQLILAQSDPITGQVEYLSTICRDLSERIRANAALRQLQQEQELILDSVPALIWYKDTANRMLRVNAAVARSLGLPKSRIEGHHSAEFYPHEADRYYRDDLLVIESEAPRYGIDEPYRLPTGEQRWIRTDKIPLKDAAGWVTGILAMAIDITDRKVAEDALRISQSELTRAQAVARIGSWRLDVRYNAMHWSAEIYRLFGLPTDCPISYETFLSAVHPDDRDAVDQRWQACLQGESYEIDHRIVVDGEVKWVREKAELEFNDQGELEYGFGTAQDITESKLAEEALRESDRRKDEFIAILAHELRNPLAPIKNAVQILRHPDLDESRLAWSRNVIERQVDRLTQLVDDLLDISRISRGKIALRRESLAVADLVARAVESCRPLIDARRHELILSLPSESTRIVGDPLRLEQVLSNLLNNAAIYTEPGGRIQLTVRQEGDEVILSVRDTGIGIAPVLLGQVFDLFVQADRSHRKAQGGLGIGLNLAKQLVDLHGGTIAVASEGVGQGCEFSVRLPVGTAQVEEVAPATPPPGAVGLPRHRVLVADDNADVLESLALLLDLMGQEVRIARNGLEAVEIAAEFQPELILLDLGMPELSGYDACRRLRAEPAGRAGAMIVALSGWGQDRHQESTREAGFDRHLVKPIGLGELQGLLHAVSSDSGDRCLY